MRKLNSVLILCLSALTTNVKAACPSLSDTETGSCIKDGCDDGTGNKKCRLEYTRIPQDDNSIIYDVVVKPKGGVEGNVELQIDDARYQDTIRNMTIEEGITGLGGLSVWHNGRGILKLPSTLTTIGDLGIYSVGFETIDVSDVKNLQSVSIRGAYDLQDLIVSEDSSPITLDFAYEHQFPNSTVNIQCKGDPDTCQSKVIPPAANTWWLPEGFGLEANYYVKTDDAGHILEQWAEDGYTKYFYDKGGALEYKAEYDTDGTFLKAYKQNDDGSSSIYSENGKFIGFKGKRIYTVEEAALVTKPLGNTFKIRYR